MHADSVEDEVEVAGEGEVHADMYGIVVPFFPPTSTIVQFVHFMPRWLVTKKKQSLG